MKILYHHRTFADGAEGIHIREMVDAFRADGHEVTVSSFGAMARTDNQARLFGRVKSRLPRVVFEVAALLLNVLDYVRFRLALARQPPDLVYKRHAIFDLGVIAAAGSLRIPVVLEVNCLYASPDYSRFEPVRLRRIAGWFEKHAFRSSTVVVAVSSPLAAGIRRLTPEPSRIVMLPNGANPQRFEAARAHPHVVRARLGIGAGPVIGWTGILRPWHRVDMLLEAVADIPDATLLIVGDGPDESRLRRLAASRGLASRVFFAGRVPHAAIVDYIATMDIGVSAGDGTGHASPMKLVEYMAMGRAVAAPRQPNIEDLIEDGVDGMLFAADDIADLRRVLARLAADDALRLSLGRNARLKVEQQRNWGNNARRILAAVTDLRAREAQKAPCGT